MKIILRNDGIIAPVEPSMELALERYPNGLIHLVAFDSDGIKRDILTVTSSGHLRRTSGIPPSTGWPLTLEGKLMIEGWVK